MPAIRVRDLPQTRLAHWFSPNFTWMSASAHVLEQLAGWHGAGTAAAHLGWTHTTDTELEIGGRHDDPVAIRLHKHVGEDRDGGFSFDYALRQSEFPYEIGLAYRELHPLKSPRRAHPAGNACATLVLGSSKWILP
jgi:hypothetical protein